jgi:hypothetical protein
VAAASGQSTSFNTGTGGSGSTIAIASGNGGAGTNGTQGNGGTGGTQTYTSGNGGNGAGTGTAGAAGDFVFNIGTAGTGGSGTAGRSGEFQLAFGTVGGALTTPFISQTGTWNTTGAPDAAILSNITCTAAAAAAKLLDLQVGSTSQLNLSFSGSNCTTPLLTSLGNVSAPAFVSTVSTGTAPFTVTSTTPVANLTLSTAAQVPNLPLNQIISPTGAITEIQDGDNPLLISSATTTSGRTAVAFNEHTASTSAGTPYQVGINTLGGSTATPLQVANSVTGSQVLPAVEVNPTWNTTGAAIGIQEVITNTAAANASRALDIKLGATNFFYLALQSGTPATAATNGPSLALNGIKPQIITPGTTPYLNMNTLVKGTMNTCTFALTTSTFTLALSPVSLCTYTLPNTAVTWYWTCTMGWSNVAGTTPTFAEGVTWAQAPSAAFQMGDISTSNGIAGTSGPIGSAASTSTTTNSNIVVTSTLTNSATLFQATMSGTFTASATSGTFSPTVSLTGTGATGTAVGGCTIQ